MALKVLVVVAVLAIAFVIVKVVRGNAKYIHGKELTCESNLRIIYLAQWHLPSQTQGLSPDKATAYALGSDMGWIASSEEVKYLGWDDSGRGHPDMSGFSDSIFCFDDPQVEEKLKQVPSVTKFTAASDIPPSSYVWYPKDDSLLLAACPYHHIAVRMDTGEIVPWRADED